MFSQQGQVATISETDYLYNEGYKARNILTLPLETRIINPANNQTIAKSQFVYDETSYPIINYGTTTGYAAPTGTYANLRGNVTTTRVWNSTNDTWIETHTQYDNFGNLRKAWDASGNVNRFVETVYDAEYNYAYPTKAIAPAPDPTGTNGTTEKSEATTTYDFNTGLVLTVTNKNVLSDSNDDVTVTTEYNDSLLRPTRTFVTPSGYAGETLIEYSDSVGNLFVKSKTQIDAANYAEATKYFDGLGRAFKVKTKDLAGDIFSESQFDVMGRVIKASNPYRTGETPVWTETEYDSAGRVWKVKAPLEPNQSTRAVSETQYGLQTSGSSIGGMVLGIDPSGKKSLSLTNALGELVSVWEIKASDSDTEQVTFNGTTYNGYRTNYTYDTLGKLRKVTQGEQSRYFAYDSLGRLIRAKNVEQETNSQIPAYTDPVTNNSNWSQSFEYDTNGNIWKQTTARNITIINTYDALNRVTKRDYSDSTPDVDYFYDGTGLGGVPANSKGKLTKVTNGVSENRFVSFDLMGKVKTSQQITDGVTYECKYTYDSFGRLVSETYPSGRVVTNSFDSLGRLASVSSQVSETQTPRIYANGFGYNDKGQPDRMRLGNGLWESIKYNNQFQVTQLGLGTSSVQTNKLKIAYDYGIASNNGNVLNQTITVPTVGSSNGFTATQVYEYDELNRIKGAVESEGSQTNWEQHFRYDRYGNRTVITNENKIGQEPVTTESVVGLNPEVNTSTNRIVPKQGTSEQYQFDASGNMTRDDVGNTFTFDAENHQKTYTEQGQTEPKAFYYYDGDGKRVKKIVKAQSGQQTIDEITIFVYGGGGALVAEYTENITAPTNPQTVYLTADALGTPRINTNQKGEVVARHDYLPFGDEIIGLGQRIQHEEYVDDDIRQKFTGYEKDEETGLDFAQARYYGEGLGRFTSVDPALESSKIEIPQSWNRYSYVLNNPLNLIDPTGLVYVTVTKVVDGKTTIYPEWQPGNPNKLPLWTTNFYQDSDGKWWALNLETGENYGSYIWRQAYFKLGQYVNFNGFGSFPVIGGLLNLFSNNATGNQEAALGDFISAASDVQNPVKGIGFGLFKGIVKNQADDIAKFTFNVGIKGQSNKADDVAEFTVGSYNNLRKRAVGTDFDAHHVGQKALMKRFASGYDEQTAPAILINKFGHTRSIFGIGVVSRNTVGFTNARQVIARDIRELRRVYPNIPNSSLRELIQMNKRMYPEAIVWSKLSSNSSIVS